MEEDGDKGGGDREELEGKISISIEHHIFSGLQLEYKTSLVHSRL